MSEKRVCRCGMTFGADTISLVNHIASEEHAQRLAAMGLVQHNHSYLWVDDLGRPVEIDHPKAHRYFREDCPACRMEITP